MHFYLSLSIRNIITTVRLLLGDLFEKILQKSEVHIPRQEVEEEEVGAWQMLQIYHNPFLLLVFLVMIFLFDPQL